MGKDYDFDYVIIGSGTAGRTAALGLATAKKKIAIVEAKSFGGAELNRDLTFKIGLDFARTYHKFLNFPAVRPGSCHFNLPTLASDIKNQIETHKNSILSDFKSLNITVLYGFAHFLDPHTIAVEDKKITSKSFILATGSEPKRPDISGLETVKYLTPDTIFTIRRLPRHVFIVGGGRSGVETAEYFASLGSSVILMEQNSTLPLNSATLSAEQLKALGVKVITGSRVTAITEDYNSKIVVFTSGASEKMVRVDSVVLATGSTAFLDYGLENAGIDYKKSGVITDKYFSTTARNIFAVGDVLGSNDSSTARAKLEAETLVHNLLHRQKLAPNYKALDK